MIFSAAKDNEDCWGKCKQENTCVTSVMNLKTSTCYLHKMKDFSVFDSYYRGSITDICASINLTVSNCYSFFQLFCVKVFASRCICEQSHYILAKVLPSQALGL